MIRVVLAEDQAMVRGAFAALLASKTTSRWWWRRPKASRPWKRWRGTGPTSCSPTSRCPGWEASSWPRVRQSFDTRVVIVTTFARAGYLRGALDAGVTGYVLKDSPIDQVATALRTVHAGGRVIDPEPAVAVWGSADPLTDRERDVLRLVGGGLPNSRIADNLSLAGGTVRTHLSSAMLKLDARNRTEASARARDAGYL